MLFYYDIIFYILTMRKRINKTSVGYRFPTVGYWYFAVKTKTVASKIVRKLLRILKIVIQKLSSVRTFKNNWQIFNVIYEYLEK